jgi:hypothetical protein
MQMQPKFKLAVVGIGTAGIQSICHFISGLSDDWQITSIHNPEIKTLGIGESSNPSLIFAIEQGLNFDINEDLVHVHGTHKFGTRYKKWRAHEFVNPLLGGQVAIHFDTNKFGVFALSRLHAIWGDKFQVENQNVVDIINRDNKAIVITDAGELEYDYVIDCRGFPKSYENYKVLDTNPINHGLVHNKPVGADWKYTHHTATKDGWMFCVPLTTRESFGYMFNDRITDVATARKNFSEEISVPLEELQDIEYKFTPFYSNRVANGRIIKNGNRAVFFEPMFANSLWLYDKINTMMFDYINPFNPTNEDTFNKKFVHTAQAVEDMIGFHYHGGSTHDTDFWQYAKNYGTEKLKTSNFFADSVKEIGQQIKHKYWASTANWVFSPKSLTKIHDNLGYTYFRNTDE